MEKILAAKHNIIPAFTSAGSHNRKSVLIKRQIADVPNKQQRCLGLLFIDATESLVL